MKTTARFFFKHRDCTAKKAAVFALDVPTARDQRVGCGQYEDWNRTQSDARAMARTLPCPHCGLPPKPAGVYGPVPGTYRPSLMGRVDQKRLVTTEHRTPCDGRCTGAQGPACDCPCGGENHGSKMLVQVNIDRGAVPVAV